MDKKFKNAFDFILMTGIISILFCSCRYYESLVNVRQTGSFTDHRDGKNYKTVKIGDQWIMAENFAYKPVQGVYRAYDNDTGNIAIYGYLYNWETAKSVAPEGWHLPSKSEWIRLRKSLGGRIEVWQYMEKVYKQLVMGGGSGFNALFGGMLTCEGKFVSLGKETVFWSSTKTNDGIWYYGLDNNKDSIPHGLSGRKGSFAYFNSYGCSESGKSVRFFKD